MVGLVEEDIQHEPTDSEEKEGGSKEENKNDNSSNDDEVKEAEIPNPYETYID